MRALYIILLAFLVGKGTSAQSRSEADLKIHWMKELSLPGTGLDGVNSLILDNRMHLCVAANQSGSNVYSFNNLKEPKVSYSLPNYIWWAQISGDRLLTREGNSIVEREFLTGAELQRHNYKMPPDWATTSPVGKVYESAFYYTEYHYLCKFTMSGEVKYKKEIAEAGNSHFMQADGGHLYIYGVFQGVGPRLMQYDTLGNQKWSVAPGMFVSNMIADKMGNVYLVGGAGGKCYVQKYNSEGNQMWSSYTDGISYLNGVVEGDSLFVCGGVTTEKPYDQITDDDRQGAWAIYSVKTGERILNQTFNLYPGEGYPERFRQIAYDHASGSVFLGGSYGQEGNGAKCILVKLSREGNTTGLKDEKGAKTSFNIFPNPGKGHYTISCVEQNTGTLKVTVRNSMGQVVQKKEIVCNGATSWELDLDKQPAGNYSIEIVSRNEKTVKKVVME